MPNSNSKISQEGNKMIDPVSPLADAFATPPSIEAALARDPAAPQPHSSLDSRHSSLPEADPSAVARFRQALALHEDLAAATSSAAPANAAAGGLERALGALGTSGPAAPGTPAQPASNDGEAAAPATRESLAAAASATLAQ